MNDARKIIVKLDQLTYFVETARHEHIGKAARILAISPSAISHSIAALEAELGRKLFSKAGKNIVLTAHGMLLKERGEILLGDARRLVDALSSDEVDSRGYYKMGSTHHLCAHFLAPAWSCVQKNNRDLIGEMYSLRSIDVIQRTLSGELDLGVCFSPDRHPELESEIVGEGQLVISIGHHHPLAQAFKESTSADLVSKLNAYNTVLPKATQGIEVCIDHPIFAQFKLTPSIDFIIDSYDVAVARLQTSTSWSFLPDFVVKRHADSLLAVIPDGWSASYKVTAIWHRKRQLTHTLEMLIAALKKRFLDPTLDRI